MCPHEATMTLLIPSPCIDSEFINNVLSLLPQYEPCFLLCHSYLRQLPLFLLIRRSQIGRACFRSGQNCLRRQSGIKYLIRLPSNHLSALDADDWTIVHIFRNRNTIRALVVACTLQAARACSCIVFIRTFASKLFIAHGEPFHESALLMLVIYIINFLFTLVPFFAVER